MSGFNPERLKEIRVIRKMTLEELATNLGVTKQAVSKYEHGQSMPSNDTMCKILKVFDIPKQYLNKDTISVVGSNSILFFRTASVTSKTDIEIADIESKWGYEVLIGIDSFEKITSMNIPLIDEDLSISEKAMYLRQFWNLGSGPIENMTTLLETNGIFIFVVNSTKLNTDAYSRIINDTPIIVLNSHKGTSVRWRFSLAHELGHLVLHRNLSKKDFELRAKEIEDEASLFASSFLMPPDSFGNSVIAPKLDFLEDLKKEWKVSIAAMIYHCRNLGILNNRQTIALQMQLSKKWGRKSEPYDEKLAFESPEYLLFKFQEYVLDRNSFEKFFNIVRLPIEDVEQLCSLEEGYFSAYDIITNDEEASSMGYGQMSLF